MNKKEWKEYCKELEKELELNEQGLLKQIEINNIAVGENYDLNKHVNELSKENTELKKELDRLVANKRAEEGHINKRIKWLEKENDNLKGIVKDREAVIKYLEKNN